MSVILQQLLLTILLLIGLNNKSYNNNFFIYASSSYDVLDGVYKITNLANGLVIDVDNTDNNNFIVQHIALRIQRQIFLFTRRPNTDYYQIQSIETPTECINVAATSSVSDTENSTTTLSVIQQLQCTTDNECNNEQNFQLIENIIKKDERTNGKNVTYYQIKSELNGLCLSTPLDNDSYLEPIIQIECSNNNYNNEENNNNITNYSDLWYLTRIDNPCSNNNENPCLNDGECYDVRRLYNEPKRGIPERLMWAEPVEQAIINLNQYCYDIGYYGGFSNYTTVCYYENNAYFSFWDGTKWSLLPTTINSDSKCNLLFWQIICIPQVNEVYYCDCTNDYNGTRCELPIINDENDNNSPNCPIPFIPPLCWLLCNVLGFLGLC